MAEIQLLGLVQTENPVTEKLSPKDTIETITRVEATRLRENFIHQFYNVCCFYSSTG